MRAAVPQIPAAHVVGEPFGCDTAAAVALGAAIVRARAPDGVFCILTADHVIGDDALFRDALEQSLNLAARDEVLVTLGIAPSFPSTGFGYIHVGERLGEFGRTTFHRGLRFLEKPDAATAERFVRSGDYLWNSGMFIWSARAITEAFRRHRPQLHAVLPDLERVAKAGAFGEDLRPIYSKLERISIDYAVMEKATNLVVARGLFGWDDVGSWPALENHLPKDAAGNVPVGSCEAVDASNCIVVSEGRLTALMGVKDLIVVQAEGVTLVCARDRAQDLKKIVTRLREKGTYHNLL
jgi:mannose-1-phosphate guanylyltransferase